MKPVNTLRRVVRNTDSSAKNLSEIRAGTANQSSLINDKMTAMLQAMSNQSALLNNKLNQLILLSETQARINAELAKALAAKTGIELDADALKIPDVAAALKDFTLPQPSADAFQRPPVAGQTENIPPASGGSFEEAMQAMPLMIAEKTYNTSHPDYDARLVRNEPGKIFNAKKPCDNVLYKEIQKLAKRNEVPDEAWRSLLDAMMEEAKTVPGAEQVFERKAYIEQYMNDLHRTYGAYYQAGWVNMDDALFLYWVVRTLKPKTIVQTGVSNGLSSAFMMLALAKNGSEGKLHVVDLPAVFDPKEPAWTEKGKVYGVVIPEGKSSGWIVPDMYKDRFIVQVGDAKEYLPKIVDSVDSIDLFYHDSDHTYNHMMFEFAEAKRKLRPGGVVLGDDVSWNASVWDFADQYGVPSYNYKGTVGCAFF